MGGPKGIKTDTVLYTQYELRYPSIGEFAGLVNQQSLIYVLHQFLLINSGNSLMSSMAFSGGLAGLAECATAEGRENQDQQYNRQNHFTYRNTLHHFSLLSARASFLLFGQQKKYP